MLLRNPKLQTVQLRTRARSLTGLWRRVRTAILSVGGFGLLSAAAWTLHVAAGLAVAGLSLLVLEWLSESSDRK